MTESTPDHQFDQVGGQTLRGGEDLGVEGRCDEEGARLSIDVEVEPRSEGRQTCTAGAEPGDIRQPAGQESSRFLRRLAEADPDGDEFARGASGEEIDRAVGSQKTLCEDLNSG
jgi:hypothetical protein